MTSSDFPPLFIGHAVSGDIDPFDKACAEAVKGCDAGLVVHNVAADTLRAAIVFAPDVPLADAMIMLPLCGVGFQNALGALAPPEVAVHLEWAGGIRINGARCGGLRVASSGDDPAAIPRWLVIGLDLPLWPKTDNLGDTPDQTALFAEGCADVNVLNLLESWVRHTLVGIHKWTDEGQSRLHQEWRAIAHGIGEDFDIDGKSGTYLGIDAQFGLLLRNQSATLLIPLTYLLERD